jgi:DNA-binding IclR family transcriptional regulator
MRKSAIVTAEADLAQSLPDKSAALLHLVLADGGRTPLRELAERLGLPLSTAYRLLTAYRRVGLVGAVARGRYAAGLELVDLAARADRHAILAGAARPALRRLARQLRQTVHLGILEADMVTYLVKEHGGGPKLFSRAGMQLEAYCSGVGKMLLASLPKEERDRYLAAGPFIALTPRTMTDPDALRDALVVIRRQGYAIDNEEVVDGLRCLAAPVRRRSGDVEAAVSVSRAATPGERTAEGETLEALRACCLEIGAALAGEPRAGR